MQVSLEDVVVGQYRGRQAGNSRLPGYLDDKTVPKGRCDCAAPLTTVEKMCCCVL